MRVTFDTDKTEAFKENTVLVPKYQADVLKHANEIGTVLYQGFAVWEIRFPTGIISIPKIYLIQLD